MSNIDVDKVIRSRRRSIAAEIDEQGRLVIRAPHWVSERYILSFIDERRRWIMRNQESARRKWLERPHYRFIDGEKFLYLGKFYELKIQRSPYHRLKLADGHFVLSDLYANQARKEFVGWYRDRARSEIAERVRFYAFLAGVRHGKIRINQARRQWGSCSIDGNLSFTWRLVMAPMHVIDSVVVHELVHLKIKNHSPRFWREVRSLFPRYDEADGWLEENSHRLTL